MIKATVDVNPELDLVLERTVDVAPEKVWRAWTDPKHLKRWFAPAPWTIEHIEIDLRPGGIFKLAMRSPEGEVFDNAPGCVLEVVEGRKLVWTDALGPGYRPSAEPFFTAVVTIEPHGSDGKSTRYVARAVHGNPDTRNKHEEMGFHDGWGKCLDQLVELAKTL